jgi:TonB family protein
MGAVLTGLSMIAAAPAPVAPVALPPVIMPAIRPVPPPPTLVPPPAALFDTPRKPVALQPIPSLLSAMDYPVAALRAGAQGTTAVALTITPVGRVASCFVEASSGSADLDSATCRLLASRSRFSPARDSAGTAVAGAVRNRIRWVLPARPVVGLTPWTSRAEVRMSPAGALLSCVETRSAAVPLMVNQCRTLPNMVAARMLAERAKAAVTVVSDTALAQGPGDLAGTARLAGPDLILAIRANLSIAPDGSIAGCEVTKLAGLLPAPRQDCRQIFAGPYAGGRPPGSPPIPISVSITMRRR